MKARSAELVMLRNIRIVILALLAAVFVAAQQPDFKKWKELNKKVYLDKKTEDAAQKAYDQNVAAINKHNSDPKATYKQNVNSNSDKSNEELNKDQSSLKIPSNEDKNKKNVKSSGALGQNWQEKLRKSVEDRKKGSKDKATVPPSLDYSTIMPAVKTGSSLVCGSQWAFIVVAILEYWSAKNKTNKRFSEQYLINCFGGEDSCTGGDPFNALFFTTNNGIAEESVYPFKGVFETCKSSSIPPTFFTPNVAYAALNGEEELMKIILVRHGPILTAVDGSQAGFKKYSSGIYDDPTCTPRLTQAILIVGYGTDAATGKDFWYIRNSWGTTWGVKGYGKIVRGKNMCGIATIAIVIVPR